MAPKMGATARENYGNQGDLAARSKFDDPYGRDRGLEECTEKDAPGFALSVAA